MVTFLGLLVLHTLAVLLFASVDRSLLASGAFGNLGGEYDQSWSGLIYFSGINVTIPDYTQVETAGSIPMINMMQSLT